MEVGMCNWNDPETAFRMDEVILGISRKEDGRQEEELPAADMPQKDLSVLPEPMRHSLLDAETEFGQPANMAEKEEGIIWEQPIFQWDPWSIHGVLSLPPKRKKERLV